ncbi:alpha/beta fold hydrolase [Deminuibacter soli]|nr:alpha/beta hydrolase [Deminuibacter soli]
MQQVLQYNGKLLYYHTYGNGPVLVLLHGFAEDGSVWEYQVATLQQHYRLIVPDLPGTGSSEVLHPALETSIDDYAAAVWALLQHEQVQQCVMLGHSMGGYITLAIAEQHGHALQGFGFVHSTALPDSEEKKANRQRGIEMIEAYGAAAFVKTTTPNLFSAAYKQQHAAKTEALIRKGATFGNLALQQYYYAMMQRPDRTAVLSGSKVPVLFIIGTEDVAVPLKDVLPQTYLPAVAYIHILGNVGHMGMWEAPEKVNRYITAFMEDCIR